MRFDFLLVGVTIAIAITAIVIALTIFIKIPRKNGLSQIGLLFVLEALYATGYVIELISDELVWKVIGNRIQYFGIPFLSAIWIFIALRFRTPRYKLTFKWGVLILIIPILVFLSAQFSYFTSWNWYYRSFFLDQSTITSSFQFATLVIEKGTLYYINAIYNVVLVVVSIGIYTKIVLQSSGIRRQQALAMAVCSVITAFATIPIFLSTHTYGIDISLYLYTILGVVILFATINYEVFDLARLAHRATFDYAGDPILILDERFEIIAWNSVLDLVRLRPIEYRMPLHLFLTDKTLISAIQSQQSTVFQIRDKRFIVDTVELRNKRERLYGYVVTLNDMTAYLERIEKLDFDASHDALTKILNRRAFFERVERYFEQEIHHKESFSLLMIDLDDFKKVNDTYGHVVGDLLLEDLSNTLNRYFSEDIIFSRYGGEEFVALIPNLDIETAISIADQARHLIEQKTFLYGAIEIQIQISIGLSYGVIDSNSNIMEYVNRADKALYEAKANGKNQVCVEAIYRHINIKEVRAA